MERLIEKSNNSMLQAKFPYQRKIPGEINWNWRLNGIVGARGTGKTTLLLQKLQQFRNEGHEVLYLRLDDLYFADHMVYDVADTFRKQGGQFLYLDEVHKYPEWAKELKNIYDTMPGLKVVFSGSSIMEISRQDVDLSRRALIYELDGLSFREYLLMSGVVELPEISLSRMLAEHENIAAEITQQVHPMKYFKDYLKGGYFPYFLEKNRNYLTTLQQVIRVVLETDLSFIENFDITQTRKILSLLKIISASAPFKPNIAKISQKTNLHRHTVLQYLEHLEKSRLISLVNYPEKYISRLQKPDKVFLNNPNLFYALNPELVNIGSVRETFVLSQLKVQHEVSLSNTSDFLIDHFYTVEVGGPNKKNIQIRGIENAFLVVDDLEVGHHNRIPLWLLGFLY